MNYIINHKKYQDDAVAFLEKRTQSEIAFSDLSFNLFFGEISGSNISFHSNKTNLNLELKKFRMRYNPLYLWIARFKLTEIYAEEFFLDTSDLIKNQSSTAAANKTEKKKADLSQLPPFLKRIKLKKAEIQNFVWKQKPEQTLTINAVSLKSRFGSSFYSSPLDLDIHNTRFSSKKVDLFLDKGTISGFFVFDFSQPRILDESSLEIKMSIEGFLLSIIKKIKPWITDEGWDQDMNPTLARFFPNGIPEDRSYMFLEEARLSLKKAKNQISLEQLLVNLGGSKLMGQANWNLGSKNFQLSLNTKDPLPISKLPLGQAKIRKAFGGFRVALTAKGKVTDLQSNNINTDIALAMVDNLVTPEKGDLTAVIKGQIQNSRLTTDQLKISLADGLIEGNGSMNLLKGHTTVSFKAKDFDAETIVRLFSTIRVPAKVDGTGILEGKVNNPTIKINMSSEDAGYEFLHFGPAAGTLVLQNKDLILDVATSKNTMGESKLMLKSYNVFSPFEQKMELSSSFVDLKIKELLNSTSMSGLIGGDFNLKRKQGVSNANGAFLAKDFSFFEEKIGDVAFEALIKDKHADIKNLKIDVAFPEETITTPLALSFDFDDYGYLVQGTPIKGLKLKGKFLKAKREELKLDITANNLSLNVFSSIMPIKPIRSQFDGQIALDYNIYDPWLSSFTAKIKDLRLFTSDLNYEVLKPTTLVYKNQTLTFSRFELSSGQGKFLLDGALGRNANSNLKVKGKIDFAPFNDVNPFISESDTPIDVDVTLKGDILKPDVFGHIDFDKDTIKFRQAPVDLEEISGRVNFKGKRLSTEALSLFFDDAPTTVQGWIETNYEMVTAANLNIEGKEMPLRPIDGMVMLSDANLSLKGSGGNLTLSGPVNIVDGVYTRNFSVTNFVIKPVADLYEEESDTFAGLPLSTRYNLRIKNTGELAIRNNLADLEMNADLSLFGTIDKPDLVGQLDFLGGQIHAFGLDFDRAKGFAQFKRNKGYDANVNLTAVKEIQEYNITAQIEGPSDNLRLRLSSSPALSHREILAVIFYGQTPDQLNDAERRNFTQTVAISQLASILSDPFTDLSGLDVLEVNSRQQTSTQTVQRLSVGKRLSDRFEVSFTTDIGITNPERAFELRYQIFDNFYLIAAKDIVGRNRYRFDVNLRFSTY
ncbi:MAG: translocation/assembly module TamB domain-containing protein [Deltaproteobacteria bacterium]|nr:translocation/assembly module TamB domain-containing protein [Deltaproteobacteria bacterium]